jgi:CheY-like chemotaxis protein
MALTWSPEIVILDIGLPGMSGYEVARQLRQRKELKALSWLPSRVGAKPRIVAALRQLESPTT